MTQRSLSLVAKLVPEGDEDSGTARTMVPREGETYCRCAQPRRLSTWEDSRRRDLASILD